MPHAPSTAPLRAALAALALSVAALGCSAEERGGIEGARPALRVDAEAVDVGAVAVDQVVWESVELDNAGDAPLFIHQILVNGSQDFAVLIAGLDPRRQPGVLDDPDRDGSPGLAPGAAFAIEVRYTPSAAGRDRAALSVFSSDPAQPETVMVLEGEGVIP